MSGITDEDVDAMCAQFWRGGSMAKPWRAAAEEIEWRVLARVQKPMHEPVSDDDVEWFNSRWFRTEAGASLDQFVRKVLTDFLVRRAAATRAEVVVTDHMVTACMQSIEVPETHGNTSAVYRALHWLADSLNGKHKGPSDPRVEIVNRFIQSKATETKPIWDSEIADLLATLDEVKP
jgi:hypothetical protein